MPDAETRLTVRRLLCRAIVGLVLLAGVASADRIAMADGLDSWIWYAELGIGGPIPRGYDVAIGNGVGSGSYEPDPGFGAAAAFGAYVTPRLRAELTFAYGNGRDGLLTGVPAGPQEHRGDVHVYSPMVNFFYEFDRIDGTKFTPWVGAGAGLHIYDYQDFGPVGGPYIVNDTGTAPFGAVHFGFDYALTPRVDLLAKYSLVISGDHDVVGSGSTTIAVDGGIDNTFFAGFRYRLSPP